MPAKTNFDLLALRLGGAALLSVRLYGKFQALLGEISGSQQRDPAKDLTIENTVSEFLSQNLTI